MSLLNTPVKIEPCTMDSEEKGDIATTTETLASSTGEIQHLESTPSPEAMQQDEEETSKTAEEERIDKERAQKNLKILEEIEKDGEILMNELAMEEALDLEQGIT